MEVSHGMTHVWHVLISGCKQLMLIDLLAHQDLHRQLLLLMWCNDIHVFYRLIQLMLHQEMTGLMTQILVVLAV